MIAKMRPKVNEGAGQIGLAYIFAVKILDRKTGLAQITSRYLLDDTPSKAKCFKYFADSRLV